VAPGMTVTEDLTPVDRSFKDALDAYS